MTRGIISDADLEAFEADGYLLVRGFLDAEEVRLLAQSAAEDRVLESQSFGRDDGQGGTVRLSIWNQPTDTIYGAIARCETLVRSIEKLLGGEAYHYHSKMVMKEALTGGAWAWHQDYGYWYQNGVLYPDLVSVFIAIDPCTRENGCLQVIRGSHRLGRIDHKQTGEQAGADAERVAEILKRLDRVYVEMEPGDILFFHANTLHSSDRNSSTQPRWSMICCYNAARNDPYKDSHHARYRKLSTLPDRAIREWGHKRFSESFGAGAVWVSAEQDRSAVVLRDARVPREGTDR